MENQKTIVTTFRLSERERNILERDMALQGYRSVSVYIREKLIGTGHPPAVRGTSLSQDERILSAIIKLKSDFGKVAINHNQSVRSVNALVKNAEQKGIDPALFYPVTYHLGRMEKLYLRMTRCIETMNSKFDNYSASK